MKRQDLPYILRSRDFVAACPHCNWYGYKVGVDGRNKNPVMECIRCKAAWVLPRSAERSA